MRKNYNKTNKMAFLNKALLIVLLVSLKLKIKNAFHYTIVSSEEVWKINYLKGYLCQLLSKFLYYNSILFYLSFTII